MPLVNVSQLKHLRSKSLHGRQLQKRLNGTNQQLFESGRQGPIVSWNLILARGAVHGLAARSSSELK